MSLTKRTITWNSRGCEFALEQSYFAQDLPEFLVLHHFSTVLFYRPIITHKTYYTTQPYHKNYANTMISVEEMILPTFTQVVGQILRVMC